MATEEAGTPDADTADAATNKSRTISIPVFVLPRRVLYCK
jgi:hypothetical protein